MDKVEHEESFLANSMTQENIRSWAGLESRSGSYDDLNVAALSINSLAA